MSRDRKMRKIISRVRVERKRKKSDEEKLNCEDSLSLELDFYFFKSVLLTFFGFFERSANFCDSNNWIYVRQFLGIKLWRSWRV